MKNLKFIIAGQAINREFKSIENLVKSSNDLIVKNEEEFVYNSNLIISLEKIIQEFKKIEMSLIGIKECYQEEKLREDKGGKK